MKLVYTREDDMRAWFYRPASVTRFTAGLDAAGNPVSFTARVASPALSIAAGFATELPKGIDEVAVEGIGDMLYAFPNLRVEYARAEPGVPPWFWRSVGHSQNVYFIEAFIDEIAAAAGKDPVEFRRSLLAKQPRLRGVLDLAAQKAGWGSPLPQGVHRGVAITNCFGSFVAQVAEVSMDASGKPRVHRIVAAVDCGRTVNPDVIHRQVEGADRLRPQRRAAREDHVQERARRAVELRRLPDAAHGRDAQGRGAHRAEHGGAGRHR